MGEACNALMQNPDLAWWVGKALKGVELVFCCQLPEDKVFLLTSSEPEKASTRSIGNNEGVAIMFA